MSKKAGFSTVAIHAGEARQKPSGAVTDSIQCASTFSFNSSDDLIDFLENDQERHEYCRYSSPNQRVVEDKLAALEGGESAVLTASGMAAISSLFLAKLSAGDELILTDECYHRTREFAKNHLSRFGIKTVIVPTADTKALEAAISPKTKLIFSEVPTNPRLSVIDIESVAHIAKRHGLEIAIDSTLATPYNLQPLKIGIDYVIHSATKYLGGHNDLLAGVVIGDQEKLADVRYLRGLSGCVSTAHNNYLLQRGLKTFALRMAQHNRNGAALAAFLQGRRKVSKVFYPGLEEHASHGFAKSFMSGYGGLVSFEVDGGRYPATTVVDKVKIARIAPSLGGVESLIEQPLLMSYYKFSAEERQSFGISDGMVRVALGTEDTDDLIEDFKQALDAI